MKLSGLFVSFVERQSFMLTNVHNITLIISTLLDVFFSSFDNKWSDITYGWAIEYLKALQFTSTASCLERNIFVLKFPKLLMKLQWMLVPAICSPKAFFLWKLQRVHPCPNRKCRIVQLFTVNLMQYKEILFILEIHDSPAVVTSEKNI